MIRRPEGSSFSGHEQSVSSNPLQEILDRHARLSSEFSELDKKAESLRIEIASRQSELRQVTDRMDQIGQDLESLGQP